MVECSTKLKEGTPDQLAHHGLIKLLVEDSLHTYIVPISWEVFHNMSKGDDIQTLAEEFTSSNSKDKEHIEAEKKTKGKKAKVKKTQGRPSQEKSQEKPQEKQEKDKLLRQAGEIKTQMPKEKRLQTRAEKTEKRPNK